jgi:branched-chain amino acid transport system ATP-binding protein
MTTLALKNLSKHFDGIAAVNKLSLSFEAGKISGLIGPNGSEKSTLINLLTGFIPYDSGIIVVGETTKLSHLRSYEIADLDITRTFQDVRLFEQMTVIDNVLVVLTKRGVWRALFETHKKYHLVEKAKEVLERVGQWEKRDEFAANLSYGQRKLLEIARAMAMDAKVYFFDEPFAGLFPEMIKVVVSIMKELRDKGHTVILVEHNMELIRGLSDYCIVMDAGKLLAEGKPEEVLSKKEVIEAYLGE